MSYYFAKTLRSSFDDAVAKATAALKEEGLCIITEIDVRDTFKRKLDVDFRRYKILGACNPKLAHEALQLEDRVGRVLPCNVVVQELDSGRVEAAAIDPVASMQAIGNVELEKKAQTVRQQAIEQL